MIVYDITIYIIPTHTIDDIHTPVSSGIRNPLPLSDHTTVSFRSLQMTVLLIPFLPTGKIGPTKIPLTPVISEMLHRLHDSIRNHQLIQHLVILRSPPWCYVSFSSAGRVIESGDVDTFCSGVGKSGLDRLASRSDSIRPVDIVDEVEGVASSDLASSDYHKYML